MNQTVKFNNEVFTLIEIISNNNQLTISFLSDKTCEEVETIVKDTSNTSLITVTKTISEQEIIKSEYKGFTNYQGIRKTDLSNGIMYTVYLQQPSVQEQIEQIKQMIIIQKNGIDETFDVLMTEILPALESMITPSEETPGDAEPEEEGGV